MSLSEIKSINRLAAEVGATSRSVHIQTERGGISKSVCSGRMTPLPRPDCENSSVTQATPRPDAGQRNEQIVRPQFDLRFDAHAVLLKKLLNIDAGTGLAFKQNQREGCNFFHRMHMVKITVIIRRSNEKLMCIEAVPDGIRVLILRFAGKRNINLTGVQIVEHHLACAIQDSDLDSRIILVERLKARNQDRSS